MTNRSRKSFKVYKAHNSSVEPNYCEFCNFQLGMDSVVKETSLFWVVKNIFPYDVWDSSGVKDHLMLVPKRHVDSLAHFDKAERMAYIDLMADYESKGYSVYSRAPNSKIKSVEHQHTHLIEIDNKFKRILFFVKNPRIMWSK